MEYPNDSSAFPDQESNCRKGLVDVPQLPVYAVIDIETTGLSPWSERITCIGVQIIRTTDRKSTVRQEPLCFSCDTEIMTLAELWDFILKNDVTRLIGWNLDGFDWPFLKIRSAILNVPLGKYFRKYSDRIDLMNILKCGKWEKLDTASRMLFDHGKIPCNPVLLWHDHRIEELIEYNINDVRITSAIFDRCVDCGIIKL